MKERIFIGVAWPYANGPLHIGHIAGCYLPADIFARFHRMIGNEVLMVSGSDQHGTPITIRADQEGVTPQTIVDRYHNIFLQCWDKIGISFDLFTSTGTANHQETVHRMFLDLMEKDYIYLDSMLLPFCSPCGQFRPDRYIEGQCPICGNESARGDQCDKCNRTLNPEDLISPSCKICNSPPEFRNSEHFFLRLTAFEKPLLEWVNAKQNWKPNVSNFTKRFLEQGLKDRAITRDISWGVPVPLKEFDSKRIYVWFEAVAGYLSAAIEWSQSQDPTVGWEPYYKDPETKAYYFIGKDNIPFHTIIWPAMLMGEGELNLPYDVPANEFLNLEDAKLSTSRNWAIWVHDYLERHEADQLRYVLSAIMPETSDSNFSWSEFIRRNNQELVATYGNLVHRILTITHRTFRGQFPVPGTLDSDDHDLMNKLPTALEESKTHLRSCHFRQGLAVAMGLAQIANRYIDQKAPWKTSKTDLQRTATTLWVCLSVISCLRTLTYPFLPFSAQKLHALLGYEGKVEDQGWELLEIEGGHPFPEPSPLFIKIEESVAEQEMDRMRMGAS